MKMYTTFFIAIFLLFPFITLAQLTLDMLGKLPTAAQYEKIKKQEVRLTLHSREKVSGILYKVTEEAITLLPKDEHINRHSHFIQLVKKDQKIVKTAFVLQVQDKKRNAGKGFLIGFGIGAIAGFQASTPGWEFVGAGLLGAGGGLVGAIIGALIKKSYKPTNKAQMERLKKRAIMYGY
ncbi:MAG: hypothetical protein AB8G86_19750 [Saprospiraceae bacterium]